MIIKRLYLEDCTLGLMQVKGHTFYTVERPDLNNERNISCIPEGTYNCVKHYGNKFKDVWRLENVPGRSAILIHAGNYASDVEGCIAPGLAIKGTMVLSSVIAIRKLRELLGQDEFELTIKTCTIEDIKCLV